MLTEIDIDKSMISHLRQLNDYIVLYSQKSKCIEYLTSNKRKSEYVIVVLYGIEVLDEACQCEQVRSILVVSSEKEACKKNFNEYSQHTKVMGIFEESNSMMIKLPQAIADVEVQALEKDIGIFSTFDRKQRSLRDLRQELASFL